jgi:hypothetical protein
VLRRVRYDDSKSHTGEIAILFAVIVMVGFAVMFIAGTFRLP